jgi:hypothetical protein
VPPSEDRPRYERRRFRAFFGGYPGKILSAWHRGQISLVLSASILAEYREVGTDLNARYGDLDFEAFAALLVLDPEVVDAPANSRFRRVLGS